MRPEEVLVETACDTTSCIGQIDASKVTFLGTDVPTSSWTSTGSQNNTGERLL